MKKILALLGVIFISSACSNTTTQSLEDKAIELCKEHGGLKASDTVIPRVGGFIEAVCKDGTYVSNYLKNQ